MAKPKYDKKNKVTKHIREKLRMYPGMYTSRLRVLKHLFMVNGNGYDWGKNGCPVEGYTERGKNPNEMDYSDLEKDIAKHTAEIDQDDPKHPCNDLRKFWIADAEGEMAERKHREKYIDLYASNHSFTDNFKYEDLVNFDPDWSLFRDAPYGSIDPEWAAAMEEVIDKINYAFNTVWNLHMDRPSKGHTPPIPSMYSRMPPEWQKKYDKIQEYAEKLDKQTGSRANRAATLRSFFAALEEKKV